MSASMYCPHCKTMTEAGVVDSRASNQAIRRRRKCENCGQRFTTYEMTMEQLPAYENAEPDDLDAIAEFMKLPKDARRRARLFVERFGEVLV